MNDKNKTDLQIAIDEMNFVHATLIKIQNSGEVDDYKFSEFTMLADNLREKLLVFKENTETQEGEGQVYDKREPQ